MTRGTSSPKHVMFCAPVCRPPAGWQWTTLARGNKAANGFCTQIGNDSFAWFGTTKSKSRLNFLDLLRAGCIDYIINDAALSYLRARSPGRSSPACGTRRQT
jgi:hypothetical protein